MALIKVGKKYYNDKFYNKEELEKSQAQEDSYRAAKTYEDKTVFKNKGAIQAYQEQEGSILKKIGAGIRATAVRAKEAVQKKGVYTNALKSQLGLGITPPKLANETKDYTDFRKQEEMKQFITKQTVKNIPSSILPATGEVGKTLAQATPRAILSLGLDTRLGKNFEEGGQRKIATSELGIQNIIGEDIKSVRSQMNEKESVSGKGLVVGMTALDLWFGSGSQARKALGLIAKEMKNAKKIEKLLYSSNFIPKELPKAKVTELSKKLLGVTDERQVANAVMSEIATTKIEAKVGSTLSNEAREGIELRITTAAPDEMKDPRALLQRVYDEAILNIEKSHNKPSVKNEPKKVIFRGRDATVDETKAPYRFFTESEDSAKKYADIKKTPEGKAEVISEKINTSKFKEVEAKDYLNELENKETLKNYDGIKFKEPNGEMAYAKFTKEKKITPPSPAKILGKKPESKVSVKGSQAMKKSLRAQEKSGAAGRKSGAKLAKKVEKWRGQRKLRAKVNEVYSKFKKNAETALNLRKSVRQYASILPIDERRKILSTVKFSEMKSGKQIKTLLDRIDATREAIKNDKERVSALKEAKNLLKLLRSKGLSGKTVKPLLEAGFKRSKKGSFGNINSFSKEQLKKLSQVLRESLDTTPKKVTFDEKKMTVAGTSKTKFVEFKKGLVQTSEKYLGTISSNIEKYGGKKLKYAILARRNEIIKRGNEVIERAKPFTTSITKLKNQFFGGKKEYNRLTFALYNGDFDAVRTIATKHGFIEEFESVVQLLKDTRKRLTDAGFKVGEIENYFPRVVNDYDGLFEAYNNKFGKEGRSYLEKLLASSANKKGFAVEALSPDERADILTSAIRGYGEKIGTGASQFEKGRTFNTIPEEFFKFYHTPEDSLTLYMTKVNDRIATKKLLGLDDSTVDNIGSLVDGMQLTPSETSRLKETLAAILTSHGEENAVLSMIRRSATFTLLTNLKSTITQISDIAPTSYKYGFLKAIASLFRSKPFERDKLFQQMAFEMTDANLTTKFLTATGFNRIDKLVVEGRMAESFRNAKRIARKGKGEEYHELTSKLQSMFSIDGKEKYLKVIEDLKNGEVNSDTNFYVFAEELELSPRVLESMPEIYVKHPNARAFYALKSWSIKILDVYRNDVLKTWKTNKTKSVKNFIRLSAYLSVAGATTDQLKEWYDGKDSGETFGDKVMANLFKIIMLSKYDLSTAKDEGIVTVITNKILPPTRFITDLSKDIATAGDDKGLYSVRNIPLVGNEIFNRVGRGKSAEKVYLDMKKLTPTERKKELLRLKENDQALYRKVRHEMIDEKYGVSAKESNLRRLNIEDRAEEIRDILSGKTSAEKLSIIKRLLAAGIISSEVQKELGDLRKL